MASRVEGPREARAAAAALRVIDADVRKQVLAQTRGVASAAWREEVADAAQSRMDELVLAKGARMNVGARPTLVAATSRRPLRGGLVPAEEWRPFEFGASKGREATTTYRTTSRGGRQYQVTRRTRRQLPPFRKGGRVLFKAVAASGPRMFALWTQTTIRAVIEAFEKGGR